MHAVFLALILTLGLAPGAAHARPCPARRYVVTSDATPLGGTPVLLAVDATTLAFTGGCTSTAATRRGARLVASWDSCAGRTGLRLKARLSRTCTAIRGRLRAPGVRTKFTAAPSVCSDGVVDAGLGEQCDGTPCADAPCDACGCGAGACADLAVGGEGTPVHVQEGSSIPWVHNPPTAGPHYPRWAPYRAFTTTLPRGYWVHNLEHGGVVLLYRPDAPAEIVAVLTAAYQSLPDDPVCGHRRAILTPDPLLDTTVAVVAWERELTCPTVDAAAIQQFVADHRNRAPEDVCAHGSFVP